MPTRFERFFTDSDFSMTSSATNVQCITGKFTEVGSKTVGAQQVVQWGIGVIANGVDSRRFGKIRLDSAAGQIAGKIRLAYADANLTKVEPVLEDVDTNWNSTNGIPVGLVSMGAREDSFLKIQLNPDSTTTLDYADADTAVSLPVTVTVLN